MITTVEEWRPVAGFANLYEVSNLGRVRSLPRKIRIDRQGKEVTCYYKGKMLKPGKSKNGYLVVNLSCNGHCKVQTIHCLVAYAFLPPCPGKHDRSNWHIDHINEDKFDNSVQNLRWLTHRENNSTPTVKARHKARPRNSLGNRFISWADA